MEPTFRMEPTFLLLSSNATEQKVFDFMLCFLMVLSGQAPTTSSSRSVKQETDWRLK